MPTPCTVIDGDTSGLSLIAPTKVTYPFLNKPTKDAVTKVLERLYEIDRASYSPATALATAPNDGADDPADSAAYIVDESDPILNPANDGTEQVKRTFAHVPSTQIGFSSIRISKPSLSGSFPQQIGGYAVFQPDTTQLKFDAYATQIVTSDSGAPGFYPTGGTYTISFGGSTTSALNYNATPGDVQTALNALTPISNRGGVTVSGTYNSAGGFVVTFTSYATATASLASLSGGGPSPAVVITPTNSGYSQAFGITPIALDATTPGESGAGLTWSGSLATNFYSDSYSTHIRSFYFGFTSSGGITGGTFTLTLYGQTTAGIAYNASASTIAAAINALTNVQARGVASVTAYSFASTDIHFLVFVNEKFYGGSYTITIFGQTTAAIAYNANATAIASALNALSNVAARGGCTVSGAGFSSAVETVTTGFSSGSVTFTGANTTIAFGVAFANSAFTTDPTSLSPSGSTATVAITDGVVGRTQTIVFGASSATRDIFIAAHGISASDTIYIKTASTYYSAIAGTFTVPDINTIRLTVAAAAAYASVGTIVAAGKLTKQSYQAAAVTVRCTKSTAFYLPGVTGGITTAADIIPPVYQGDPATLLQAIFGGSGTVNYDVGDLTPWMGPILQLTTTTVNAADL